MVVDAIVSVKSIDDYGNVTYPLKAINVLKAHGKSARESTLLNGYALNMGRAAQARPLFSTRPARPPPATRTRRRRLAPPHAAPFRPAPRPALARSRPCRAQASAGGR